MAFLCALLMLSWLTLGAPAWSQSARSMGDAASTRSALCIGCFVVRERLKAFLVWGEESVSDLDLHIWHPAGPDGSQRRETYYNNSNSPPFGSLRCDDEGADNIENNDCALRGERFVVSADVPLFPADAPLKPYCFVVRRYDPATTAPDEQWDLWLDFDGLPAYKCSGSTFRTSTARQSATRLQASDPRVQACLEAFGGIGVDKPVSGVIVLAPLAEDFRPDMDAIAHGPGANCESTR
ncbi:MAG: hypothetical protein M5U09_01525 [Gammaproteobacteria bacterium]|nr:hypothetical protein [Gammaproteobacteria bacterium]